uniref:Lectin BRA-3-like n=1 Tax=Crassostrea virginica TaxID=6565 RepID=A0A8B8EVU5_CRAVI|nr:lectin BRA-3-like [Crassostrea virginica]
MRYLSILTLCTLCMLVVPSSSSNATQQNQDGVLMKNISDLHFQLFSSIHRKTKMIKTAVFETQCSGSGCTFNGCESSGSDTCDGQMIKKLKEIQSSINDLGKPKEIDCKRGWKPYNGHCYKLFQTKMNWFEAQYFCRLQMTTLLQINDANENKWVSKAFANVQYWIDYTDIGEEGNWFTLSTGKNEFSNWSKGQPDNGGDQDCTTNNIGSLLGQWDDKSCHAKWPVLCEASGSGF